MTHENLFFLALATLVCIDIFSKYVIIYIIIQVNARESIYVA